MPWTDLFWNRPAAQPSTIIKDEDDSLTSLPSQLEDISPTVTIVASSLALSGIILLSVRFYKHNLRRIPTAPFVPPRIFRHRTIYGYVTSVGDGDNFRLFHTPGGRLAGWGILPSRSQHLPSKTAPTKLDTIHIRIAGVDAPELAHFGRPAQPYGAEALTYLRALILHRNVRVQLYRRDQYERVVGTAWVAPVPSRAVAALTGLPWPVRILTSPLEVVLRLPSLVGGSKVDVGLDMIRAGMATVYEAKFGSEFGGAATEARYRAAEKEAKKARRGMWGSPGRSELEREVAKEQGWGAWLWSKIRGGGGPAGGVKLESPREYKNRMKEMEEGKAAPAAEKGKTAPASEKTAKTAKK